MRRLMRDDKLRRYFKAIADKTRFDIIEELGRTGESSVSSLCLGLGVTQPLMSWHVRVLRAAGVVATRRHGRQVFCSLDQKSIASFQERFDLLVQGRLSPTSDAFAPTTPSAARPTPPCRGLEERRSAPRPYRRRPSKTPLQTAQDGL